MIIQDNKTNILVVDYRNNDSFNKSLTSSYKKELISRGHIYFYLDPYETIYFGQFLDYCINKKINTIIHFSAGNQLPHACLNPIKLRSFGIRSYLYHGDSTENFHKRDLFISNKYDGVFVSSPPDVARFADFGIPAYLVLSSYNPADYNLHPFKKFIRDDFLPISFIGDIQKADRSKFIDELIRKDIKVSIYNNLSHNQMCKVFANSFISLK